MGWKTVVDVNQEQIFPFLLNAGVYTELRPGWESFHGEQPSQEQVIRSPATERGWARLEQPGSYWGGPIQVTRVWHCRVCEGWAQLDSKDISPCYVQFPQPRVSGDGWNHGSHGPDQSVLRPRGPESSTSRSWTRSGSLHRHIALPLVIKRPLDSTKPVCWKFRKRKPNASQIICKPLWHFELPDYEKSHWLVVI